MMYQILPFMSVSPGLQVVATILALAIAIILHEVAHGYVAFYLGDPTAKYAGRLSLNPLVHIDLWGTILIPLFLIVSGVGFVFGWAKPVPVNYYNLRYGKWGPVLVALAGPATNLVLTIIFALLARFSSPDTALPFLFFVIAMTNALLMFFNIIPIPPLDGSKVLYVFLEKRPDIVMWLERYGFFVLLMLMVVGDRLLSQFVFYPASSLVYWLLGA